MPGNPEGVTLGSGRLQLRSELRPQESWEGTQGREEGPMEATKQTWEGGQVGGTLMLWPPAQLWSRSLAVCVPESGVS